MADVENPNRAAAGGGGGDGGGFIAVTMEAEPDDDSGCLLPFCGAFLAGAGAAASALGVLMFRAYRGSSSLFIRMAVGVGLAAGIFGLVMAACFCGMAVMSLLCGNFEGRRHRHADDDDDPPPPP
ncbi:hypothetical protein ACP4OV_009257 [Aristida adscensionis]